MGNLEICLNVTYFAATAYMWMLCFIPSKSYKALPKLEKGMKIGEISRNDVAYFLLTEAEKPKMLYEYVALTN